MNMKTIGVNFRASGALGGISGSFLTATRKRKSFHMVAKAIARSTHLVRRQLFSTDIACGEEYHRQQSAEWMARTFRPAERELLTRTLAHEPVSESIIQMANYPSRFELFGSIGLSKMCLSMVEFMFEAQNHPEESARTILLANSSVGILEFSVTRDQARLNQAAKDAVKSTMDFLRRRHAISRRRSTI